MGRLNSRLVERWENDSSFLKDISLSHRWEREVTLLYLWLGWSMKLVEHLILDPDQASSGVLAQWNDYGVALHLSRFGVSCLKPCDLWIRYIFF